MGAFPLLGLRQQVFLKNLGDRRELLSLLMHYVPIGIDGEINNFQHGDTLLGGVPLKRMTGDNCNPQSASDGLLDCLVAAELQA